MNGLRRWVWQLGNGTERGRRILVLVGGKGDRLSGENLASAGSVPGRDNRDVISCGEETRGEELPALGLRRSRLCIFLSFSRPLEDVAVETLSERFWADIFRIPCSSSCRSKV